MYYAGHGQPPEWTPALEAAKAWGVPPWTINDDAPALWMDRFVADRNAEAAAQNPKKLPVGGDGKGRRLI